MSDVNRNLGSARKARNDEFYTLFEDIDAELGHYRDAFRGRVVYCNCDDPERSSFWQYFDERFDDLCLHGLVSTHYVQDGRAYKLEIRRDPVTGYKLSPVQVYLESDGDFRSDECAAILDSCDMVVSNPPFSLFRDYVMQLVEHGKAFIVIGSLNAVTYKEIFPLMMQDRIWLGYTSPTRFLQPDGTYKLFGNVAWYTNIDILKRHAFLPLSETYVEDRYPKYDNYDAICVDRVCDIPCDYDGVMGVPITFLGKYCPEQFEIVGITKSWFGAASKVYGEQVQVSRDGSRKRVTKLNDQPARLRTCADMGTYYVCGGKEYVASYQRILIRHRRGCLL